MTKNTATSTSALLANEVGCDPIEDRLRLNICATIEAVFEEELEQFLGRCRYRRGETAAKGYRHGHRERQLIGTFGTETVSVPRARIKDAGGKAREWRSKALPRYQRLTKKAEALIAAVYLSGTNTRRVKRALFGLFQGAVSKDVVAVPGARSRPTGRRGAVAASRMRTSCGSFWTAPLSRRGSTRRPPISLFSRLSACAGMARRFCCRSLSGM